ncbi:MAG: LysR family transcriptional regulator [Synechococcaceae cyanobacterium]|nr:LysR family transcriptional regulator [Synechococcaceae cyanobacterium]
MFPLDQLAAFDLYCWLENEASTARMLGIHQASVSRRVRQVTGFLDLRLNRRQPHLALEGDASLLNAERRLHQRARLRGLAPLRIEASYCAGPWYLAQPPEGWISGPFELPGMQRPLALLRERVIDAWIGSYQPDLPDADDPEWWVCDLVRQPVRLLASPDHPLAGVRRITDTDLAPFPSLALPSGWFPRTEAVLKGQGLWGDPVRIQRYDPSCWEGRCADGVTLTYGQSLSEALQPAAVRLDWDLELPGGDALVVRRDLWQEPALQQLAEQLMARARQLARRFDDVEAVH